MSLKDYRAKRKLAETQEPKGGKAPTTGKLPIFCVQKHAARHLHYDFRLEYKGRLLSWAIPKGPSMNPSDKRLCIQVEDHPYDYKDFEGTIPKGSYGAGTVLLWDKGTYAVPRAATKAAIEKAIGNGLEKGHLDFILHGSKLQGAFTLVKIRDAEKSQWLLIKKGDSHATTHKVLAQDASVTTQRTMDEITENKPTRKSKSKPLPKQITPMLATLVAAPFNGEEWLFEIKWDGYRGLAFLKEGEVTFQSRTHHSFKMDLSPITTSLEKLPGSAILDGELVILDKKGISHFQDIQNYQTLRKGHICYAVFDLLFLNGEDLRERPLIERKALLKTLLRGIKSPHILYSDHILHQGVAFFAEAEKAHLEGIMGKKMESAYQARRSADWVKIKTKHRQEVVIGGFTAPRGSRKGFGALLVGLYEGKKLKYKGHVGGGFDTAQLKSLFEKLTPLIQKQCPFDKEPKGNEKVTWVKPKLVCEVSFTEWTQEQSMRHPIFEGLRTDKLACTVAPEKEGISHPDKVYFPKEKYTKQDLADYYTSVAPVLLPYLKNRPIVLQRFPEGIKGGHFYQKEIIAEHPSWIETFPIKHEERTINYLLIKDLPSLLYAVNLGSIEIHPFLAEKDHLDNPSYCVLDLDPEAIGFNAVIEVAQEVHALLDAWKIKHFCKTSGASGLHIYLPLHGKYTFEQSKQFAQVIAATVHEKLPRITSLERSPAKRQRKVYLDYLQNRSGQTVVAPYAVRPRPGAPVSTPLLWEEVKAGLDPADFTIKTTPKRIQQKGDLFKGVLGPGISMEKIVGK